VQCETIFLILLLFYSFSLDSVAAKPEPIDWDFYSKNVSKPGMVEAFRKAVSHVAVNEV